ncbi:UDP-N-acetylmuramate dehydrogenase [Candidatus Synchoanobacter obligatus]|uniref:UDP-N-acetylenolpyruvoylglucosamine reductase n=1 Tax=Candidatus Synchoanobacter obligatus TaxID=2919597 RepID=A0ABT1L7H6_9GAMM|nr:UDP-N-acetylmuramate dehydrogenase [Candidatus Synchoanobacter obligatus]MCP8352545.1 UDP-N-acetylmuramate dehydrogenase [Candidatus Synchoanobacter obligatus]
MHVNYPIKSLNSWRLGDRVRYFSQPQSLEALVSLYEQYQHVPTIWLGLGSNILFSDDVLNAHIIRTNKALSVMSFDQYFYVEAGVSLAKFAKFCMKHGCVDAVFLAGIPGTIGGALAMNAGAYKYEIWQHVDSVTVLTSKGIRTLLPSDFKIGYRCVQGPKDLICFLSAKLSFIPSCALEAKKTMKQFLLQRNTTQPIGTFNCGSVFRNPEGQSAGKMVDQLGLLGYQVGMARVSPKHGNFIENIQGKATSADVRQIIQFIKEQVFAEYGIQLQLEVKVYE